MMKMFTDTRTHANVQSFSDSITIPWLLTHASGDLAQCDDHCSLSFSIKQWKVKRMCGVAFCLLRITPQVNRTVWDSRVRGQGETTHCGAI